MGKAKAKKQAALRVHCWAGTPNELEERRVDTPAKVKGFLRGRIAAREKWAAKFSKVVADQLRVAREQLDNLDVQAVAIGSTREWRALDEHTGVTFVFGFEMEAK